MVVFAVACHSPPPPSPVYEIKVNATKWIHALGSDDLFESEPAIDGLAALGSNAIPALEAAFEREDAATRRGVIEVLQRIDSRAAVPLLLRAVGDPDEEVRIQALEAIGTSGDPRAGPIVERALNDPIPAVCDAAVVACAAACNSPAALRHVVEMALHNQPFIRASIPRQTLRYILQQRDEERARVARSAIQDAAAPLLHSASGGEKRLRAALLLADSGDPKAIPVLHRAVARAIEGVSPNVNVQMQLQAIAALGQVGNEKSVGVLGNKLKRRGPLQSSVCRALEQLARRGVDGAEKETLRCASFAPPTPPTEGK